MRRPPQGQEKVVNYPSERMSPQKRKRRFNINKSKLPVLFLIMLMVYTACSFGFRFDNLYTLRQDIQQLQVKVDTLKKKNAELDDKLEKVKSDAYVEKVAREKLGLIKAGETKVVPVEELPRNEGYSESEEDLRS